MRSHSKLCPLVVCVTAMAWWGCGDDDEADRPCDPVDNSGCELGLVCEVTIGGEPACFAPVEIRGVVFDAQDQSGIAGATVVALDANGFARTDVAVTGEDGRYALAVAATRTAEGVPVVDSVTLRVDAQGYQHFPTAPRTALPIDLTTAADPDPEDDDSALVVDNAATDVALIALLGDTSSLVQLGGRVDHVDSAGVLIVAVRGQSAVTTAITDIDGEFTLFNVPTGNIVVDGYRSGLNVTERTVEVSADDNDDVILEASTDGLATVSGSVNIVETSGVTTVILGVESTFDETAIRAEAPAGLRAADVTGGFTIEGVPPGNYVVLAAYENDDLVRDPDEGISGTDIVHITVPEGSDTTIQQTFKVTKALGVVSPGAEGLETISDLSPELVWGDDSGEDGYEVRVYDAFGELVHEDTEVDRVTGGATVSYTWTDASLEAGMIYQFRVVSFDDTNDGREYMSATEDLKGVFMFEVSPLDQ